MPAHGHTSVGQLAKTYPSFCADIGCRQEDLPRGMAGERDRVDQRNPMLSACFDKDDDIVSIFSDQEIY